jgi:hypothetical protein
MKTPCKRLAVQIHLYPRSQTNNGAQRMQSVGAGPITPYVVIPLPRLRAGLEDFLQDSGHLHSHRIPLPRLGVLHNLGFTQTHHHLQGNLGVL